MDEALFGSFGWLVISAVEGNKRKGAARRRKNNAGKRNRTIRKKFENLARDRPGERARSLYKWRRVSLEGVPEAERCGRKLVGSRITSKV